MPPKADHLVFVASCMIDFVSYTTRLPNPGETLHSNKFATNFGGKGANQCVQAAKLGAKTFIVARVGDDEWGQKYIDYLNSLGVDTRFMKITPNNHTGIAQIVVAESGENQIVINAGANNLLSLEDVEEAREIISTAALVVTQLEIPTAVALRACQLAGGVSILNGAPALHKYEKSLLSIPTIFCVNETELGIFLNREVASLEEAKDACKSLIKKGTQTALVTLGPIGALYLDSKSDVILHKRPPKVNCIDTTGAGDSFIGAFANFYSEIDKTDISLERVVEIACYIAAFSTEKPGTQISYCDRDVINKIPSM